MVHYNKYTVVYNQTLLLALNIGTDIFKLVYASMVCDMPLIWLGSCDCDVIICHREF